MSRTRRIRLPSSFFRLGKNCRDMATKRCRQSRQTPTPRRRSHWTGAGGPEVGKILASRAYSRNELDAVQSALKESSEGYIFDDSDKQYFQSEVFVFDRSKPNLQSTVSMPESNWTPLSAAREKLKTRLSSVKSLSPKEVEAFYTAAEILVEPSVAYDSVATETARQSAADSIEPRVISLKRGQKIADEGDIITATMLSKIAALRSYASSSRQINRFVGILILVTGLFWLAWKFIQHRGVLPRLALTPRKTFALLGFVIVVQTGLMAAFFRLAEFTAIQNVKAPLSDPMLWSFAVPFATASLLLTLLADRPTALFAGMLGAFIAGFLAPRGFEFAIFSALISAVAVYGIGRYRSRQTVTIAGGMVGVGECHTGNNADIVYSAADHPEYDSSCDSLRLGRRYYDGRGDRCSTPALREFIWDLDRC